MHLPPAPQPRDLLPPLLACLPSPTPPPALLPLLSPLLRERLRFLPSGPQATSSPEGWLPLLSWNSSRGSRLPAVVGRMQLEPHPISGEVEFEDPRPAKYRRLDEETLQSRFEVEQFEILPVYEWSESDEQQAGGSSSTGGWKLAELMSLEDLDSGEEWYDSVSEANTAAAEVAQRQPSNAQSLAQDGQQQNNNNNSVEQEDDDDAYWNSYDRTPGRTPAKGHSPAPQSSSTLRPLQPLQQQQGNRDRQAENVYYARYGNEVQPAMDSHDPDEESQEMGESTLSGDSLMQQLRHHRQGFQPPNGGGSLYPTDNVSDNRPISRPNGASMFPADTPVAAQDLEKASPIEAPRPLSPTSSHSSIERLEEQAVAMSERDRSPDRAHLAIKQHISTDIKSLFRLARSAGMERSEFEETVRRELEILSLLERDE